MQHDTRYWSALACAALVAAFIAPPALAHSPYLLPNGFTLAGQDHVSVEAAFSEHVFVPAIAMQSDLFHVGAEVGLEWPIVLFAHEGCLHPSAEVPADALVAG